MASGFARTILHVFADRCNRGRGCLFWEIMALPIREGLLKALNCGILCRRNYRCNVIGDEQVKNYTMCQKTKSMRVWLIIMPCRYRVTFNN
jgi:hypothetical protein